jgi:5-azacytidine-induced protein 1
VGSPLGAAGRPALANEVFDGVRTKLLDLRVEVEEKTRMVKALKAKLIETKKKAKSEAAKQSKEKDAVQADAEQAINRQLAFIDRLLGDKKSLGEKNAQLIEQQKATVTKFEEATEVLKQRHAVDIRKAREKWSAAERVKREKWAKEKMKSIKDSTIQGLAPEIQRLISTHQSELRRLRATHGKEMLAVQDAADERCSELSRKHHAEQQKQLTRASEDTLQAIESRVSRQEQQHAAEIVALRDRHAEEKDMIEHRGRVDRENLEESHRRATERIRMEEEQSKAKLRARIESIQDDGKRHIEAHSARTQEATEREQAAWLSDQRRKFTVEAEKREAVIREQMQERLDDELKMVIDKMAKDGLRAQEEVKRRCAARADRLEGELASERSRSDLKCEQLDQRCEELADRIAGLSDDLSVSRREREAAQIRVQELEKLLAQARSDASSSRVAIESELRTQHKNELAELSARHADVHRERQTLQMNLDSRTAEHEDALRQVSEQHASTLGAVSARVRATIAKKEEVITSLRRDLHDARARIRQTEKMLEKQREELLM